MILRVLIGYSRCPLTRAAFEAAGHEAWTCDLREQDHPRHLACDVWEVLHDRWDMAVLHPMCTYLTTSAAYAFLDPDYGRWPGVGYHQKIGPDKLTGAARRGSDPPRRPRQSSAIGPRPSPDRRSRLSGSSGFRRPASSCRAPAAWSVVSRSFIDLDPRASHICGI